MSEARPSYAIFGTGETDPATAVKLLSDQLGLARREPAYARFYCPEPVPRRSALESILGRLEVPALLGIGGAVPVPDPVEVLLARRAAGEDVMLVALVAAEPPEEDTALLRRAREAGIRVLDLANALDDLDLDLVAGDEPPAPAAEEPAVPPPGAGDPGGAVLAGLEELIEQVARRIMQEEAGRLRQEARRIAQEEIREFFQPSPTGAEEVPDTPRAAGRGSGKPPAAKFSTAQGGPGERVSCYVGSDNQVRLARGENGRLLRKQAGERLVDMPVSELNALLQAEVLNSRPR